MMKKLVFLPLALVLIGFAFSAISNGQRPSNNIPLNVRIEGKANTYTSTSPYRIVGDGGGVAPSEEASVYEDGKDGVYARFQIDSGSNDFILDPTDKRVAVPRALYFDFSDRLASGAASNPWFGSGLVKIDTYVNFREVYSVQVGGELRTNGGFGQLPSSNKTYRVFFNTDPNGPNFDVINDPPNYTAQLVVTHPDCNTWIITPDEVSYTYNGGGTGAVSALVNLGSGSSPAISTGMYLMSFRITLTRKTLITCP